jgi:hypothetical protein
LSPQIIEAIAEGQQPPDLTVFSLMRRVDLPLLWSAQKQALGLRALCSRKKSEAPAPGRSDHQSVAPTA